MSEPTPKSKARPTQPGKPFARSASTASWVFGLTILAFLMLMVVFGEIAPSKQPIIRLFMALSAGFSASFFLGDVVLNGKIGGLQISAAGGIALFILMQFVFDPFQVLPARSSTVQPGPMPVATQTPAATQSPAATQTPAATQSSSATPTRQPESTPPRDRNVSTEAVATPGTRATAPNADVGATLKSGEGLNQSGNPRNKLQALDLYRAKVKQLGCGRFAPNLLKEADDAYSSQNYDTAFEKYRAVLRLCQNK